MSDRDRAMERARKLELQMPTLTWDQRVAVMARLILEAQAEVLRDCVEFDAKGGTVSVIRLLSRATTLERAAKEGR